jgi:hypothetical protein
MKRIREYNTSQKGDHLIVEDMTLSTIPKL